MRFRRKKKRLWLSSKFKVIRVKVILMEIRKIRKISKVRKFLQNKKFLKILRRMVQLRERSCPTKAMDLRQRLTSGPRL